MVSISNGKTIAVPSASTAAATISTLTPTAVPTVLVASIGIASASRSGMKAAPSASKPTVMERPAPHRRRHHAVTRS